MKVIDSNNITAFDCDGTLIVWANKYDKKTASFEKDFPLKLDYGDEIVCARPHENHVLFLKHCYLRGDTVIIWSKNGVSWAEQIVKSLKLENYVHYVMSKPSRHVDDKTNISEIVGDRVFIPE